MDSKPIKSVNADAWCELEFNTKCVSYLRALFECVRMAKRMVVKVKLMFIGCSGSNCSAFY